MLKNATAGASSSFSFSAPVGHRQQHRTQMRPLLKLTVNLVDTYIRINKIHYQAQKRKTCGEQCGTIGDAQTSAVSRQRSRLHNGGFDDADFNYIIKLGEYWGDRYRVDRCLGKGSFGQVVEAFDLVDRKSYAVKIIKNRKAFYQQALVEIGILEYLNEIDSEDRRNIVCLKRYFEFRNHLCLVYELLSFNLYEMLRSMNFTGVSLGTVQKFANQLLIALDFLVDNDKKVIHCDLKPENILLRSPNSSLLKVIDFGSSCYSNQRVYSYIQSRFYRSPEVILGHQYGTQIDMWSLGCVLVELLTGKPLFNGLNEHDQICKIYELLGPPPAEFLRAASLDKVGRFFRTTGMDSGETGGYFEIIMTPNFKPRPFGQNTLRDIIMSKCPHDGTEEQQREFILFLDLIQRLLIYDPAKRLAPATAKFHPFLLFRSRQTQTPGSDHQLQVQGLCVQMSGHSIV